MQAITLEGKGPLAKPKCVRDDNIPWKMTRKVFLGQRRFVEIFHSLNTLKETYQDTKTDSASPKTCQHHKLQKKSL